MIVLTAMIAAFTVIVSGKSAAADIDPEPGVPETVTADALPTWQINGVVWDQVTVGNTVYAVGEFTKARPPGAAPGDPREVDRHNILAYDITTGELLPFAPVLNGEGRVIAKSPDETRIYVGGNFTTVNGLPRSRLVAFDTATGAIDPAWTPSASSLVRAIAVSDTTVYVGGNFGILNGRTRERIGAVTRDTGALLPWYPRVDHEVWALLMSPDDSRVILGGKFQTLNGEPRVGIGAVDPVTAESMPWSSSPLPARTPNGNGSYVTDLTHDGTYVYASNNGDGWHYFDGRFAVDPNTGDLIWLDNCYGASYSVFVMGQVLYTVGHPHDCRSLDAFPETNPATWHRAIATTTYPVGNDPAPPSNGSNYSGQPVPRLLHWFPAVNAGTYTGQYQGGWSLTGNERYLAMGGEFTQVNGRPQQGLTRFAIKSLAPQREGPIPTASLTPTVTSLAPGTVKVTWPATWDRDNEELTYEVLRSGTSTPIRTLRSKSAFWRLPGLGIIDTGLEPGATYTYRVRVRDGSGNSIGSGTSLPVTVAGEESGSAYTEAVAADEPSHFWRLGEAEGPTVFDHAGFLPGTADAGVTRGTAGAIADDPDTAATFSGNATGLVYSNGTEDAPTTDFTLEAWIRTTTNRGGKILGYASQPTEASVEFDRHLYMDNSGRIWFGVYPGAIRAINSPRSYNDGQWHHIVATLSESAGMVLYVDGRKVAQDPTVTSTRPYPGYWRIGGDNLNSWPSRPTSRNFAGVIDDVAIYPSALSQDRVVAHYVASGRENPIPPPPADAYGKAVYNADPAFYYRLNETSGNVAADSARNGLHGTYTATGLTRGVAGGIVGTDDTAVAFSGGGVATSTTMTNPTRYSLELWFSTTTDRGGKLIGFGNRATGNSTSYDRHVYMTNDGRLAFGAYTGANTVIFTEESYNDGEWHHVVATQGPDGMKLYVDGELVGTASQTGAQNFTGYWRIGGDNLNNWPSRPTSNTFTGTIDEVAVYTTVLSAEEVALHWRRGSGTGPGNQPPEASFTVSCAALQCTFDASGATDPDGRIVSYAWDFGDGETGTGVTATHTYPAAGDYRVTLTVTDDLEATGTATETAVPRPAPNPPALIAEDAFGRTVSGGLGTADTGGDYTLVGNATAFAVDGSAAKITLPNPSSNRRAYLMTETRVHTDVTYTVAGDKTGTGNGVYIWAIGRAVAGEGDYRARLRLLNTDRVALTVSRTDVAGTETLLSAETLLPDLTYSPGLPLKLRVRVTGTAPTTLEAKAWPADRPEPADWQVTATDATEGLQAAGGVGFGGFLSGSATNAPVTLTVDDFTATSPASPPTAAFTPDCDGLTCTVDASAATPGTAPIESYTWSFGDGTVATGVTAEHTYTQAGTYTITLTVTGADGRTDVATHQVTVS